MSFSMRKFFISTGRKNVMYTLRCSYLINGVVEVNRHGNHVCTLSSDKEKALQKAQDYVASYIERVCPGENLKIFLDPCLDIDTFKRQGRLSAADTKNIEMIENGIFPFGKNSGQSIESADEKYILFWADQLGKEGSKEVADALSAACLGVAMEKGYIKKREIQQEIQKKQDELSNFVGNIGERLTFKGVLKSVFEKTEYVAGVGYCKTGYFINKLLVDDNVIVYMGKKIGEVGDEISLKGTVKKHSEYKGVKSTLINRPTLARK